MPSASSFFRVEPLLTMLSDTVKPIEVEEVALIGEREGQMNLSIATLLRQLQNSTGLRITQSDGSTSDHPKAVNERGAGADADGLND